MDVNQLNYSTVRIIAKGNRGISTGTGFIIKFAEQFIDGKYINAPAIVTNKHVVEGAEEIAFRLHASNLTGERVKGFYEATLPLSSFIMHPNPNVDLCAVPIAEIFVRSKMDRVKPYYYGIRMKQIPNRDKLTSFCPSDEIIVVGYPNGIWDEENNLPVFRKGILATAPSVNYGGEGNFLIDCAIYPGSSGSPVFTVKHLFNRETFQPFVSIELLGVVYATYNHSAQGEIAIQNIPTNTNTQIPNHLGLVLNTSNLHELNEVIKEHFSDSPLEDIHDARNI